MTRARRVPAGLGLTLLAAAVVVACSGQGSHVVQGRRYAEARDCMEAVTAIDVVEGADTGQSCAPTCLSGTSPLVAEGGVAVYVSTQCPPLPATFDLTQDTPACTLALAAFEREDLCSATGSTNPRPDAGPDAAGPDARDEPDASDSGSDASDAST